MASVHDDPAPDRRARKRLATRRAISTAATLLFETRGFDNVTIDEIADAADVGRMTVFNHFPRKEDMFFDRLDEGRALLRNAVADRAAGTTPIEALRLFAHQLVAERRPFVEFSHRAALFVATVTDSETLKSRARAIRDELAETVALAFADAAGRTEDDPDARLAAALLLATAATAYRHGHAIFRATGDGDAATTAFLALMDRGSGGVAAAMAATPYG